MNLAHRNVLFDPAELPTFKNCEISQDTRFLVQIFFKYVIWPHWAIYTWDNITTSWMELENDTEILLVENLAWKYLQSKFFSLTLENENSSFLP